MTRVCPQCGNATSEPVCGIDRWSTVPIGLIVESGLAIDRVMLGRYRVGALLKSDGSIKIYGGLDERTSRPVRFHVVPIPPGTPLAVIARMQRAAKALESLRHPALVPVLATAHTDRGDLAIITDHLAGPTLAERLRSGPIDGPRTAAMGNALFAGLEVAHAAGVAHHDLSPERVVMPNDDEVVIERTGIFDLLRMLRSESDESVFMPPSLAYCAPEMARDKDASRQADIYSVGAILYEALTGRPVFDEPTAADRLVAHLSRTPPPPSIAGVRLEGPLVELITHCLVKKPQNRPDPATAARFASDGVNRGPVAWQALPSERAEPFLPLDRSPAPFAPAVPAPLITRDTSRPRVEAKTEPQLEPPSIDKRRRRGGAVWPWLAVAALLAFIVWHATKPPQKLVQAEGVARLEAVAFEHPLEVDALKKAAADAKAKAEVEARKRAADDKSKAEAKAKAEAEAEARAEADAKVKAEAEAKAEAKAKVEADSRTKAAAEAKAKAAAAKIAKVAPDRKPAQVATGRDVTPDRRDTPPAAAFRRAAVMTIPPGATVSIEGAVIGKTPTVLVWQRGERGYAIVKLEGYESRGVVFDDTTNGKTLELTLTPKKQ